MHQCKMVGQCAQVLCRCEEPKCSSFWPVGGTGSVYKVYYDRFSLYTKVCALSIACLSYGVNYPTSMQSPA